MTHLYSCYICALLSSTQNTYRHILMLCPTHTHTVHTPSAKPSIPGMLVFTLHVYPDRSIQLIQQLPDLDLKLTLTDRALRGRAHFPCMCASCGANLNKRVRDISNWACRGPPHVLTAPVGLHSLYWCMVVRIYSTMYSMYACACMPTYCTCLSLSVCVFLY